MLVACRCETDNAPTAVSNTLDTRDDVLTTARAELALFGLRKLDGSDGSML